MNPVVFLIIAGFWAQADAADEPTSAAHAQSDTARLRILIETDAGGDPDDEQSLVRFLLYANEWDVEGIVANRPRAWDGENQARDRTGSGLCGGRI